ncbi:MAG: hypothetical protein U1F76_02745 [Candidatus Competibacteraceae bacterium]
MSVAVAHIVHSLPGRTRLKIPDRRGEPHYFTRLSERLSQCAGIVRVETNPRTGSLLLEHTIPLAQIAAFAQSQQLFTLGPPEPLQQEISRSTQAGLRWLNRQFAQASEGLLSVRVALILGLAGLIFIQVARGQILMPATNLLWFLVQALDLNWPRDGKR